jgi:hypothetical protein
LDAPEAIVFHLLTMLFGRDNPLRLRRLLRYFAALLTAALIASIIANPPRFEPAAFDWREIPVMWTIIFLIQLLWVFVDLIPSLKERKRPSP